MFDVATFIASIPLPYSEPVPDDFWWWRMAVVILLSASAAVGLTVLVMRIRRRDRNRHGPANRKILRSCGLNPIEQRLIIRLSRRAGFAYPASLLISEGCFDHAACQANSRADEVQVLNRLRMRLFPG